MLIKILSKKYTEVLIKNIHLEVKEIENYTDIHSYITNYDHNFTDS